MIKVSVLYPNAEGKKFDMDYYIQQHAPLVARTLGNALQAASYDKGIGGGAPGTPAPNVAMANLYFNSLEEFGQAFGAAAPILTGELPNYTDITPVLQISEVMD
ncbi:MAG: EthD family reductase [Terrimonas sp.]|nr:EthD family reductase [Terrimonas sp.]